MCLSCERQVEVPGTIVKGPTGARKGGCDGMAGTPLFQLQGGFDSAPGNRLDRAVFRFRGGGQQDPIEKPIRLLEDYVNMFQAFR